MNKTKKLYIFETNDGYGPTLHVEASNEIKAYEAARYNFEKVKTKRKMKEESQKRNRK